MNLTSFNIEEAEANAPAREIYIVKGKFRSRKTLHGSVAVDSVTLESNFASTEYHVIETYNAIIVGTTFKTNVRTCDC